MRTLSIYAEYTLVLYHFNRLRSAEYFEKKKKQIADHYNVVPPLLLSLFSFC